MTLLRRAFLLLALVVLALATTSVGVQLAYQAEAEARTDEMLAALRADDGRPLPFALGVTREDTTSAPVTRISEAAYEAQRAAAVADFAAGLRAGPWTMERPGPWMTGVKRLCN